MTTSQVFRDISIQFSPWDEDVNVVVREVGGWISFKQAGTYIVNLHFAGASQEDLEAAAEALRKLLPAPVAAIVTIEEML